MQKVYNYHNFFSVSVGGDIISNRTTPRVTIEIQVLLLELVACRDYDE